MLNDGTGFKKVYLATGFTDLRRGIDGLARIIRFQFQLDPYDKNTLFLFCGKRTDRIKVHFTGLSGRHSVLERPLSGVNGHPFFS